MIKYNDDWNGWKESCRHCNRGISVVGKLNQRGFCQFCIKQGNDFLYSISDNERMNEKR